MASAGGSQGNPGATGGAVSTSTDAGACPGGPASFQIVAAPNTSWCLGSPADCGGWLSVAGPSGTLQLYNLCQLQCDTCTAGFCPPIICGGPSPLPADGISYEWDGKYFAEGATCGTQAMACLSPECAGAGHFQLNICAFPNPDPTNADACGAAPSSTPFNCMNFDFEYPFTGVKTIVLPG